jgi:acetolactate synthase I/II/III large subunit
VLTTERTGSDFMADVIKTLGFEYICANPGSSFRGLHESVVNYGGNKSPELITCCHEESAVAMAHGYAKIDGKPMAVMAHGTVGLQHAAMAIYNAWCDRVPVYLILGNNGDAVLRRAAEWYHSAQDVALMVRDYTKWDDMPWSLPHFAESAVRAYKIAVTPPMAPVVLGEHSDRRRSDVRPGRPVDGRSSPHSASLCDAQQPVVSPGVDARAENGEPSQSRH